MAGEHGAVTLIAPGRSSWSGIVAACWRRRDLLRILVLRELQVRYRQAAFGVLWALLQPGLMMLLFWVAFGKVAGIRGAEGVPYPLFALSGLVLWQVFAGGVQHAAASLVENERLITKVYFPRLMLPIASVGVSLVDFAIAAAVLLIALAVVGHAPGAGIVLLAPALLLALAASLGLGVLLAALNIRYRDVRYVLPLTMQAMLIASPVAYPLHLVPETLRPWFAANPMAGAIELFRAAVLGTPLDAATLLAPVGVAAALLVLGLWYFARTEREFADRI